GRAGEDAPVGSAAGAVDRILRELRLHAEVRGDVSVGARVGGAAVAPLHEAVARIRHRRDRRAVGAVRDDLRRGAGDRSAGTGAVRQRVGLDVRRAARVGATGNAGAGPGPWTAAVHRAGI